MSAPEERARCECGHAKIAHGEITGYCFERIEGGLCQCAGFTAPASEGREAGEACWQCPTCHNWYGDDDKGCPECVATPPTSVSPSPAGLTPLMRTAVEGVREIIADNTALRAQLARAERERDRAETVDVYAARLLGALWAVREALNDVEIARSRRAEVALAEVDRAMRLPEPRCAECSGPQRDKCGQCYSVGGGPIHPAELGRIETVLRAARSPSPEVPSPGAAPEVNDA